MRISDWSSDVCSSDLFVGQFPRPVSVDVRDRQPRSLGSQIAGQAAADTANPLNGDAHILAVVGAQTIFDGCLYAQEYAIGRRGPRVAARTGLASRKAGNIFRIL